MNIISLLVRKPLAIGAGLLAGALALSGCSVTGAGPSGGATGKGTGTVHALFMKQAGYSEDDVAKMVGEFEKKNPDIDVEPTFVSYEALHDKIVTAAPAGTYDVFLTDVIWPAEFASKGIAADLTGRIPGSWKTDVLGGALDTAKYEDKYYGVPLFPSTKLFYYNKDLVASVGASEKDLQTWDGVLKVAEKIKAKGKVEFPLSWSWSQAEALVCDYAQLLGAFGGRFTADDGKLAVNSPEGVAALQWMMDSIHGGLSNPSSTTFLEDDVTKSLAQGQTAFALNWESTLRDLDDPSISKVVGKIGVMQTPAGPSGDRPGVNGSMALSIGSHSKNQDAAWKFIEFMSSRENQEKYAASSMPSWKSSYDKPEVTKTNPEVFKAAGAQFDNLISRPAMKDYNRASQALQVELQNALLGKKSAQQAMDDAVAAANKE